MRNLIIALLLLAGLQSTAQTLFTYGPHSVSKAEFWRAYTRNNTAAITETSVQEYLDLYIRFKLKVQAARDLKLDTLTSLQSDIAGFRAQMADQFMRQQGYLKELIEEAALRSQTELEVAHVFVAFGDDSVAARQKIEGAWRQLKAGAVFSATARTVSTDPYVRATDGYIGFISVFSLPYELESVVYALQPGGLSAPVKGPNGWHIFRLLQRRPTLGTLQAAHILLAVPEGASQQEIGFIQQKADSVYRQLVNGLPFAQAVEKYSDDKLTYMAGGVLPAFTFSSFDTAFSQAAFALAADGAISRPVRTRWGWHIIRRISLSTTAPNLNDATVYQQWNERVMASDRMEALARRHREEMKRASGYKPLPINEAALWQLTDSTLEAKNYAAIYRSQQQKPLFQLKEKTISVADWLRFARGKGTEKQSPAGYARLLQEFTETTVEQYYKDRLERMNDQFRFQVQEFTEGSLLFEVMERKIWSV
ncbi:MAG TPA: peptidylprolyl isomerase, partial [Lacibacter sp.]|nr:peptidylprolyl isomerase [Lacibacter sp.]